MKDEILKQLDPLFAKARAQGLWFFCPYQAMWFSPDELQKQHDRGCFIWGPVNWTLRDPKEHLRDLEIAADEARTRAERFRGTIK